MAVPSPAPSTAPSRSDDLEAPSGSAVFARYLMPPPPADFYPKLVQEVLPTFGFEYRTTDFHSAIQLLNERLSLRLDEVEMKVLGLMLTGLSQANRFSKMLFIDPIRGENSAAHSINTAILVNELFRRAGLLDDGRQNAEVAGMRVETTLCALVHDMGEMLGELNTLEQRSRNKALTENPEFERKIFHTTLLLAYKAVLDGRPADFYGSLRRLREAAGIAESDGVNGGASELESIVAEYSKIQLPHSAAVSASVFLRCFDLAELKQGSDVTASDLFRGYVAKAVEHVQGNRHLIRHAVRDPESARLKLFYPGSSGPGRTTESPNIPRTPGSEELLPLSYREGFTLQKVLKYTEGELGYMFKYARSANEIAFAKAVRDATYTTLVEGFYAGPPVVDLRASGTDPEVDKRLAGREEEGEKRIWDPSIPLEARSARLREIRTLLAELHQRQIDQVRRDRREAAKEIGHRSEALNHFETRGRLMDLYLHAIEVDYRPKPEEILGLHRALPEELRDAPRRDWRREALHDGVPPRSTIRGSTGE